MIDESVREVGTLSAILLASMARYSSSDIEHPTKPSDIRRQIAAQSAASAFFT